MYCIGLIKPRNTETISPKSLSLFSLSLQKFSTPQEQETLGFLAARTIEGKKTKGGATPLPLCAANQICSFSLAATQTSSLGLEISCYKIGTSFSQIWSGSEVI